MNSEHSFGSDNHAPVHPLIFEALIKANEGYAPSYGTDELSNSTIKKIKEIFALDGECFFVFNGTAANVLALRALTRPGQSVFCSDVAHLHVDEAAAPEFFTDCKLIPLKSTNGKVDVEILEQNYIRRGDRHYAQTKVLSLTQPTELGTVYSYAELKNIINWAKSKNLRVHIDGARLSNACITLQKSLADLTFKLGVDAVSFGGTKNGLLGGEVVLLAEQHCFDFEVLRKQAGQLPSKTRYLAAQFSAYLKNNLYLQIAEHSLNLAKNLSEQIKNEGMEKLIVYPVESNAVFLRLKQNWIKQLRKEHFFYVWDEKDWTCRMMTSWKTEQKHIDSLVQKIKELYYEIPTHSLS